MINLIKKIPLQMDKYFVYIIRSSLDYYYIGQTKDLKDRLKRHNSNRSKSTKNKGHWEIVTSIQLNSRSDAVLLEKKLKKMKNSKKAIEYLRKLV